jgi:hypothetical protein
VQVGEPLGSAVNVPGARGTAEAVASRPAGGAGGGRVPAPYRDTALLTVLGGELIGPGQQRHAQRTLWGSKIGDGPLTCGLGGACVFVGTSTHRSC